jgi:pyruvate/2-oxoacid:ferredoxin oxidoreductase beta subunit
MSETIISRLKDLPSTHLLGGGTAMCAGCGGLQALHEIYDILGGRAVFVNAAGCILALAPCPTGWDYDPALSVEVGRLAVRTGMWPLKEYADGKIVHTRAPHPRLPVEEYLKLQGRFAHLFEPTRNEALLREIQAAVDEYWRSVG